MTDAQKLKAFQEAGAELERRMVGLLVGMPGTQEMRVRDINHVASMARQNAFDLFRKAEDPTP